MSAFNSDQRAKAIAILRDEVARKTAVAKEQTSEILREAYWRDVFETTRALRSLEKE